MSKQLIVSLGHLISRLTGVIRFAGPAGDNQTVDDTPINAGMEYRSDVELCPHGSDQVTPMSRSELDVTQHAVADFRSSTKALFQLGFSPDLLIDIMVGVKFEDLQPPSVDRN